MNIMALLITLIIVVTILAIGLTITAIQAAHDPWSATPTA